MAENSKISWTDHTLRSVLCLVAIVTQRKPVGHLKAKLWKISEWFYVVSAKVAAFIVAASLAGKFVAEKNIISPTFVPLAESFIAAFRQFAISVRVAGCAAMCFLSRTFTDVPTFLNRAWAAPMVIVASLRSSHSTAIGEGSPFHRVNPGWISLAICPYQFHFIGARHG